MGPTVIRFGMSEMNRWKPEWGTRLKGYFLGDDKRDPARRLTDHDDWDCMEDMEKAGLIEIMSVVNGIIVLTEKGMAVAGHLRAHKSRGGNFASFEFKPEMLETEKAAA